MANWWEAGEVVKEQPSDKWWEAGAVVNEPASEIPRRLPPISLVGDRATGFRQQVEATGMTPEERTAAVQKLIPAAASVAAGPIAGSMIRGAGTALPFLQRAVGPIATAIESGGFRTGLETTAPVAAQALMRVGGGGISGALSGLPYGTDEALTGATIGAALPGASKFLVEPFRRATGPTLEAAEQAAKDVYTKIEKTGIKVKSNALNALAAQLRATAEKLNYIPETDVGVQRALDALSNQAAKNEAISVPKLEKLRRVIGKLAASRGGDEGRIGNALVEQFDQFVDQVLPGSIVKDMETARDLWAKMSRSATIERVIEKANQAVRNGAEQSVALRKAFDKLRDPNSRVNRRLFGQFTDQEKDVINKLAEGKTSVNALESWGQLAAPPRAREIRQYKAFAPLATYGGVGALVGPAAAAAIGTTGYGARALANQLASAQAQRLAMQARTGLPMGRMAPEFMPQFGPLVIDITKGSEAYE